jgi:hypothetical protein
MMPDNRETAAEADGPTALQVVLSGMAGIALIFGVGVVAGVLMAAVEGSVRSPAKATVGAAVGAALIAASAIYLWRTLPKLLGGRVSPRTRQARSMIYLSAAIGLVLGTVMQFGMLGQPAADVWNGPMPPAIAALSIGVWLIAVPIVSWRWWRNIDEVEALAYKDGSLIGIYAYCAIAPTWWMGWRGGFFPEPDYMITFLVVLAAWGLTWTVRRFA